MSDRSDTTTAGVPGDAEVAPSSASSGDSGREAQPDDGDSVERSADRVERLERQNRPMGDDTGINPNRTRSARGEPKDEYTTAEGDDSA